MRETAENRRRSRSGRGLPIFEGRNRRKTNETHENNRNSSANRGDAWDGPSRAAPSQPQLHLAAAASRPSVRYTHVPVDHRKREIDIYRNGLMFEGDNVVGVRPRR